jgi:hypothetical protein
MFPYTSGLPHLLRSFAMTILKGNAPTPHLPYIYEQKEDEVFL